MKKLRVKEVSNIDGKFLILENDAIGQNLLEGKRWEPHFSEIASKLIKPRDTVVDAGANFGHHTVVMANLVGESGQVHSFEPLRVIYQQLCANVFLNSLTNVFTYNEAIGDNDFKKIITMDKVDYFQNWVNIGNTRVSKTFVVEEEFVDIISFDAHFLIPSFIKVDIQGSELKFLNGAKRTLTFDKPTLFIEIEECHLNHFGTNSQEVIDKIKSYNYDVYQILNDYPCDYICFPSNKKEMVELIKESNLYTLKKI